MAIFLLIIFSTAACFGIPHIGPLNHLIARDSKMGKRKHGDAANTTQILANSNESTSSKKPRRDQSVGGVAHTTLNGSGEKKKKKSDKKQRVGDLQISPESSKPIANGESDHTDSLSAASKESLKKSKNAVNRTNGTNGAGENGKANRHGGLLTEEDENSENFEARRLAKESKKARKAALKEKKLKAVEDEAPDSSSPKLQISPNYKSSEATFEPIGRSSVPMGYLQDTTLSALPQSDIDSYLASRNIRVTDENATHSTHRPIIKFKYLPVTDETQKAPFQAFDVPTPIQAASWPYLLDGRDMVGVAETGSGKTLAFGVPCIRKIISIPPSQRKGIKAAIVSPTRELACQIHEQLVKLAEPAGLKVACIYGGVPKDEQRFALKKAHIVVATPGRLNDLIQEGAADLSRVSFMCLDEADRMLDKGFEDDIRKIISLTSPASVRQTVMFTATWPQSIRDLAATFMKTPVRVYIGDNAAGDLRANTRIEQVVEVVEPRNKEFRLLQILRQYTAGSKKNDRILVFCLYKKEATRIEGYIRAKGFKVAGIHGDLTQPQRTASLEAFKSGKVPLLVATDVAARGLDIPAVKLVLNVTFPLTAEDYVHRIGRTGRAGQDGKAITLFTEHDKHLSGAYVFKSLLGNAIS
jgi:ATP-dependent RNA helicase DBP3